MNKRSSIFKGLLFGLTILAFSTTSTLAQGVPSSGGLDLTPSVDNPYPGQEVTITAQNYSTDISGANITWSSGGKILAKGVGVTSVKVTAPVLGKQILVTATASISGGTTFTNSITISSAYVDMIVESGGYVPATFLGKIPVAYQNNTKVVAVPHIADSKGVEYDPKTLVYKWEQGSKVLQDQSGYGRQSITIPGTMIPRPYLLSVTVTTSDGRSQGVGMVTITPEAPSLVFYKNDPLYGVLYNNAVSSNIYMGNQREVGVVAVPYGFNAPVSGLGDLQLSWMINRVERPELTTNKSVTLRSPEGSSGASSVELNITNKKDILQQAGGSFTAIFSNQTQ